MKAETIFILSNGSTADCLHDDYFQHESGVVHLDLQPNLHLSNCRLHKGISFDSVGSPALSRRRENGSSMKHSRENQSEGNQSSSPGQGPRVCTWACSCLQAGTGPFPAAPKGSCSPWWPALNLLPFWQPQNWALQQRPAAAE